MSHPGGGKRSARIARRRQLGGDSSAFFSWHPLPCLPRCFPARRASSAALPQTDHLAAARQGIRHLAMPQRGGLVMRTRRRGFPACGRGRERLLQRAVAAVQKKILCGLSVPFCIKLRHARPYSGPTGPRAAIRGQVPHSHRHSLFSGARHASEGFQGTHV